MNELEYQSLLRLLDIKQPRQKKAKELLRDRLEGAWHLGHSQGMKDRMQIELNRAKWLKEQEAI
jgi:hypothetical protein